MEQNKMSEKAQAYLDALKLGQSEKIQIMWSADHFIHILDKFQCMEEALKNAEELICAEYCGFDVDEHHPTCVESGVRQAIAFDPLAQ